MAKPTAATDKGFGKPGESTKKASSTVQKPSSEGGTFGFTPKAEIWNGRLAMLGFLAVVLTELITEKGVLAFWGLR